MINVKHISYDRHIYERRAFLYSLKLKYLCRIVELAGRLELILLSKRNSFDGRISCTSRKKISMQKNHLTSIYRQITPAHLRKFENRAPQSGAFFAGRVVSDDVSKI